MLFALAALSACAPEDWTAPSPDGIPSAADIQDSITVDQTVNQVTFKMMNPRCYPIWIFNGKTYSTVNGVSQIYAKAGTYNVEMKIGNANGISDGSITRQFTINNSIVDFSSFLTRLAGDGSKEWVIAYKDAGHLSCGDSGTDGTNWYSAAANEKAAMGIYDDVITFSKDYSYTYDPGKGGTTYVNTSCTTVGGNPGDGKDYMLPTQKSTAQFSFDVDGDNVYLKLPAKTLFPYIPNDAFWSNPIFRIVKLTNDRMELISDNGQIAWHFILVTKSSLNADRQGYDPDHACNLWKNAKFTNHYFYAPGWKQIADPVLTQSGNSYTFSLPEATTDQWQAQCFFDTDVATNAANNYDFSCKLTATKDVPNATVKLFKTGEDGNLYFMDNVKITAGKDNYIIHSDMKGIDMSNVSLILDFGGNSAGTDVTISDVVIKEHSCDDGTKINQGGGDNINWNEDSKCNIWKTAKITNTYYYAPDWKQIADPVLTQNGSTYTIDLPSATAAQWQAQCFFNTDIATNTANTYDFRCVFNSNKDIGNVTVKLFKTGDNDTFFFVKNISLKASTDYEFKMPALAGLDISTVSLVLDFGGNSADTQVTLSGLILKESACNE
jgi:hypothetical protein